jgi:predicted extracellular nuclease
MRRRTSAAASIALAGLILTGATVPPAAAAAGDELFISEYVEGSSFNKAVEIYNPTASAVDLAAGAYALRVYFNGSTSATSLALTGSIPAGGTYVFADEDLAAFANQTTNASLWNGDDAVALVKDATILDVIGQIGTDPGSEWGTGDVSTQDNTIRRSADICVGDGDGSNAFDPSIEWEGFATNTFDGLGSHTADCGDVEPPAPVVVINEFSASTTLADVEYVELYGPPDTSLSQFSVLEIEGDIGAIGTVDEVITFTTTDAAGFALVNLPANALENGTLSLLLITGTAPAVGTDLDANDDGVLDEGLEFTVVDSIAVNDASDARDRTYGPVSLVGGYDGQAFAPGGASRIPDGVDTDTTADWVRNDFDLAGIEGFPGSLVLGEAVNTPGAPNATEIDDGPGDGEADCATAVVTIGSVQGSGAASPVVDSTVRVEGVVTGDFQVGGFNGYYVQGEGDGDSATSDGIFVYAPGGDDVAVGDSVHVVGEVSEFNGLTEITADDVEICASGVPLPAATPLTLPATDTQRESLEGMRVTLPQSLTILEYFEFGRFGTIDIGLDRQYQPTATFLPGTADVGLEAAANLAERITVDDGRSTQNPDPAIHPNGMTFTLANTFRGGDVLTAVTGVLDQRFGTYAIQPTQAAQYEAANPRPAVPEVGGDVTVASFNVLNYFTTVDPTPTNAGDDSYTRGADTAEELARQQAKIVAALAAIDADVFGLIEIENSGVAGFPTDTGAPDTAVSTLTDALNAAVGAGTYAFIPTGPIGTDAITTALLYKPSVVTPVGAFQLMDQSKDPRWLDDRNRPGLTQTFEDADGGAFTVVVNHLKSKGSACPGDADPEQGNCNIVRTQAAEALADWLATDPTGQDTVGRELIIGDLNAYDKEDPIRALETAGYTDLLFEFQGEDAYTYVFDGQLGYLDHALAGTELLADVTGASAWNINADEPSLIDYDMTFKLPAQDALFAPDPYRSSDHDPVIVGLSLTPPDTTPPTITATADPDRVFPPNGKDRIVDITIDAADDSGEVTVELVSAVSNGAKRSAIAAISDTEFRIRAVPFAVYTITYEATDAAGNVSEATVEIRIQR